jgi:N-acyl-D-amino-acid deacylase
MLPLFRDVLALDNEAKKNAYRDVEFRRKFKEASDPSARHLLANWMHRTPISALPTERGMEEQNLGEVAKQRGVDPTDLALDLSIESDFAARFRLPFLNYDENEVRELLVNDNTVVALSDAGAHASQLCDACYSTHFLGHWSRDEGIVELAVHMLTQKPADVMGFSDRGRLQVGLPADVVVFDATTVGASALKRVHDLPAGQDRLVSEAIGIQAVIVNGQVIRENGNDVKRPGKQLPGQLLRRAPSA